MVGAKGNLWSFSELSQATAEGKRFVVLGDYGAGKSSTLRQLFKELAKSVWKNKSVIFRASLAGPDYTGFHRSGRPTS
jgi:ABC-type molybdenum transport system ATPase subunit/photorepair protein PhrA